MGKIQALRADFYRLGSSLIESLKPSRNEYKC